MFLPQTIFSRVNHVGISISPYAVRGVIVDPSKKIIAKAEIIAEELLLDGENVNIRQLVTSLTQLKQLLNINQAYAACCFPEKLAYTREHILPPIDEAEINEAINWQLGSIFPFKPDDLYADWKLIQKTATETRIVISAVNKKIIDGLVAGCNAANIKPLSFESSASALARSFQEIPEKAIIIDIDNFGSSSSLVENGVSSITATTNFSSSSGSQNVLSEIGAIINQLKNKSGSTEVPIYATGEKAAPEIISALSSQIGVTINSFDTNQVPSSFQSAYVESISTIEAPESSRTINLLPKKIEQLYQTDTDIAQAKTVFKYGAAFSSFAFLLASGLLIFSLILNQASAKQLAAIPDPPTPPPGINLSVLLQKSQKLAQLKAVEYFPARSITTLVSAIDPKALKQINYDASKKTLKVSLGSLNRTALIEIKSTLDETKLFGPISIPLSALNSELSENIVLILTLNDNNPTL